MSNYKSRKTGETEEYWGKGVGQELLNELYKAKKQILICSPYLSLTLVEEVLKIKRERPTLMVYIVTDAKAIKNANLYEPLGKLIRGYDEKENVKIWLRAKTIYNGTLHSKLYIIDEISFSGTMNFTHSGTSLNDESITKHLNKEVVNQHCERFWKNYNTPQNKGTYEDDDSFIYKNWYPKLDKLREQRSLQLLEDITTPKIEYATFKNQKKITWKPYFPFLKFFIYLGLIVLFVKFFVLQKKVSYEKSVKIYLKKETPLYTQPNIKSEVALRLKKGDSVLIVNATQYKYFIQVETEKKRHLFVCKPL